MSDKRPIIVIKKKGGHGGHHGGAWKVAYADFVTAMMSLFIVLWLMSSSSKVKEAVAGYFNDPKGSGKLLGTMMQGKGEAPKQAASTDALEKLKEQIEKEIKARKDLKELSKQVEITVTPEGLRIELIEGKNGTFFESGSARLSENGQQLLALLASQLKTMPNSLLLEGHTDATPYSNGNGYSNWDLSADRANSARRLLQSNGVRDNQVTQVRGYADQMLKVKDNPTDPSNRRISILVKNDTEAVPVFSAEKIVNGATPLPGSAKDPKAKQDDARQANAKSAAGGKPGADSHPLEEAKAGPAPVVAPPAIAAAAKPVAGTPAAKPDAAKPGPAKADQSKPGLMDRLKSMLPGHKK